MCTGLKGTWLRSREQYGDFNFRFEYRLKPGGNSGIYLRVPADGAHREGGGVEVQLLDDAAKRYKRHQAQPDVRQHLFGRAGGAAASPVRPANGTRWKSTARARRIA